MMENILATFALFFALMTLAAQIFAAVYERKRRKFDAQLKELERQKEIESFGKVEEVHAIIIDNMGFLVMSKDPAESPRHVFCERMRSFCNSKCQFFATSITDNDINRGKPRFECWMLPICYQAKEMYDWRNTDSCTGPKCVR